MKGLGWKIFGLLVSIFLIGGGLSGELVLRGTNSSEALVVVGFLFLIWDIYSIATHKKQQVEQENENPESLPDNLPLQPVVQYDNSIEQAGLINHASDPKLFSEASGDMKRLKSAGITLTVAAAMAILIDIISTILYMINVDYFNYVYVLFSLVVNAMLLTAGIYLLKEKQIDGMLGKRKSMMIILVAISISVLLNLGGIINNIQNIQFFGWQTMVHSLICFIMNLSIALFAASVLFASHNKNLIRKAAVTVIVLAGSFLLWQVYYAINRIGYTNSDWQIAERFLNLFYNIIPVAFIVLAGTYLSVKHRPVVNVATATQYGLENSTAQSKETVVYNTVSPHFMLEHKIGSKYHRAGENQTITANRIEIGRDPDCEVRYDEFFETVSRRHAAIVSEGSVCKLVPLSQTNSTLVNGQKIQQEWYLQHGDEIQFAVNGPKLGFQAPELR